MKDYVQINSQVTINATCGLQFKNKTNPNSRLENNMKIDPVWAKLCIVVKKGIHWYPSEVADWHSVKKLIEHKVASIVSDADECPDSATVALKKRIVALYTSEGLRKPEEKVVEENFAGEGKPVEGEVVEQPKRRRRHVEPKVEEAAPKQEASLEELAGEDEVVEEEKGE